MRLEKSTGTKGIIRWLGGLCEVFSLTRTLAGEHTYGTKAHMIGAEFNMALGVFLSLNALTESEKAAP